MRPYLTAFLLVLLTFFLGHAQSPVTSPKRAPFQLAADLDASDYVPQVVVLRVKDMYRPYCTPGDIQVPGLEKYFAAMGKKTLQRAFPHTPPPSEPTDALGRKMADLSLIYEFQYSENIPIEDAVNALYSTGLFEYAEPLYIYEPLFDPSDPDTAAQYYLSLIQARPAWDISKGDTSIVIGVVDTGTSFSHPELATEYQYNLADPIDGVDNDGDGYVDNYRGWDLGGNYWLSPGDNDPTWFGSNPGIDHGVIVAGPAVAATDNGTNIASVGFNCRLLPVKVSIDLSTGIYRGFQGLVYAADHGADIINLSWGGTARTRMGEDAMNYAAVNKGALVVVSGGNTPSDLEFIPATYHRALGIGGTQQNDAFWSSTPTFGSTYNYLLDLSAPSRDILTIRLNAGTFGATGTSLGSPIVCGAAGLVLANSPSLTPEQAGQQVRVSSDQAVYNGNPGFYAEKMGRGRVNAFRALTDISPSVRVLDYDFVDPDDGIASAGDTVDLQFRLVNFLAPVNGLQVTASIPGTGSNFLQVVHGDIHLGTLNTMDTASLRLAPFRIRIATGTPAGYSAYVRLQYTGNGYSDTEFIRVVVDADYVNLDRNRMEISFTGTGRWGYADFPALSAGRGWVMDGIGGLMNGAGFAIGTSASQVSDNYENQNGNANSHFQNVTPIDLEMPGLYADAEARTVFNDNGAGGNALEVSVAQNSYQFELNPDDNYIIQEYIITNNSTTDTLHDAYAGTYFDLDGYWNSNNVSVYDSASRSIYNFTETWVTLWNMGVALLTPDSLHGYAADINNFGFTTAEKWTALSSPPSSANLNNVDVIQFASAGPFDIPPGGNHTIAFAFVGGDSVPHMRETIQRAHDKYWCVIRGGMAPQVDLGPDQLLCVGDTTISLSSNGNYTSYLWSDGSTAPSLSVDASGTYWVKVTDANGCEDYDQIEVRIGEGIQGGFTCTPTTFYVGDTIQFADTTSGAMEWGWNFGDGSITCPIYPTTSHSYQQPGTYEVQLVLSNGVCSDTVTKSLTVDTLVGIDPALLSTQFNIFPNPATDLIRFNIGLNQTGAYTVRLRNHLGQTVEVVEGEKWEAEAFGQMSLERLAAGVYLVEVEMGGVRVAKKLLKR